MNVFTENTSLELWEFQLKQQFDNYGRSAIAILFSFCSSKELFGSSLSWNIPKNHEILTHETAKSGFKPDLNRILT